MPRIDELAARLEPPFSPEVETLIELLDQLMLDDEREPDADYEPWLSTGIYWWKPSGGGLDLEEEPERYDSAGNPPFVLDQTEVRHGTR